MKSDFLESVKPVITEFDEETGEWELADEVELDDVVDAVVDASASENQKEKQPNLFVGLKDDPNQELLFGE